MRLLKIVIALLKSLLGDFEQRGNRRQPSQTFALAAAQTRLLQPDNHLIRSLENFRPLLRPVPRDRAEHRHKSSAALPIIWRKISSAKKRLTLRRQPHAHRPAAVTRSLLHIGHVNSVEVRPFFPIYFDRHKVLI